MPDLSEKSGNIVYCPTCGEYYNASKHASCPRCKKNKKGGFQPTGNPGGSFVETAPPAFSAGFNPTQPPDSTWGGGISERMGGGTQSMDGVSGSDISPVVGWLVAVSGPCRGMDYHIHANYNHIGREEGDICIQGDMNISARQDSDLVFVPSDNKFYIGHVQGKNVLKVNGVPAIGGGVELHNYDRITIGATELIFVGLCGEQFSWGQAND